MSEQTYLRSFAKAFSWRIFGSIATMIVVFALTGRIELALAAGGLEFVSKILLFFAHERIWDRIPWGLRRADQAADPPPRVAAELTPT